MFRKFTNFGKGAYLLLGDGTFLLLSCLDHILAKECPKSKGLSITDYLGHLG